MSDVETDPQEQSDLIDLGIAELGYGNLDEAERYFLQALRHVEMAGEASDWLTYQLAKLAEAHAKQSHFAKAETVARIALKQAQTNAALDPELKCSLTGYYDGLGDILQAQKMFDEAEEMFNQSYVIDQAMSQDEDPSVAELGWVNMASDLHNIATVAIDREDYARAESLIREALKIDTEHLASFLDDKEDELFHVVPPGFLIATKDLYPLAHLCKLQNKHEEAETFFLNALAMCREYVTEDGVTVGRILRGYASLLRETGRAEDAEKFEREADRIGGE